MVEQTKDTVTKLPTQTSVEDEDAQERLFAEMVAAGGNLLIFDTDRYYAPARMNWD